MKNPLGVSLILAISIVLAYSKAQCEDIIFRQIQISEQIFMLQGKGGNIGLIKGKDGILIIDDDFKVNVNVLEKTLQDFGDLPKFIVNTHWHGDHTGGNTHLGQSSTIIAHTNVRNRLSTPQEIKLFGKKYDAQPESALPVITFDQSLSLHFNEQELNVIHYPHGHTDGDSVIYIKPANVVHMGDHFFSGRFPFVDLDAGGDVIGLINNVKKIIDQLPDDVVVIPGHGPLSTLVDLKEYHRMLVNTTNIIQQYIDSNLSLEEAQDKGLPSEWSSWGENFINQDNWIKIVYTSLKNPRK